MFGALERVVAVADEALDAVAALDPSSMTGEEVAAFAVAAHRLQNRCDAIATKATDGFDRYGDPQGALGTAPWMAWKCRMKKARARAELSRARALRHMPEVTDAYVAGAITSEHVQQLGAALRAGGEAMFEKAGAELLAAAFDLRFDAFARQVSYFRMVADPDGTEERALDAFERRSTHASRTFEDTVVETSTLDPVGGAIYLNELRRLEQELFEADWAEARARLGAAASASDLQRTPEQRRSDAKVQMAIRSIAMPSDARQARVLLTVLLGYETFAGMMCQLADGTVVSPAQVAPWLTDADVERVVFDGPSRVVDVGAKQRLFTGATRRAVEARDLFCTHESCDVPYERCDIDHIQRYEHGGPTVQVNGRVRCPAHNPGRRRPRRRMPPDGERR
jgi:hypothetical protein